MTQITENKNCTGCGACHLICPQSCISMKSDDEGFYIPHIDASHCTNCGDCTERCPQNLRPSFTQNNHVLKVLGVRYKNDEILSKSSSGGVFPGIAAKILDLAGSAVFGCAFDEDIVARHICVTDMKNITPLQSSKYVQSDTGETYMQAKYLLDDGKTVFFTGCPCQIAGLYAFLGKDYDNLLTADLICHGVPSPLLFKLNIQRHEKIYGGKITDYNFRSKKKRMGHEGWGGYSLQAVINQSINQSINQYQDPFFLAFLRNKSLMESCYACRYANANRIADITMGDFWGIEKVHSEFYDRRGVSAVLINTKKGISYFETVMENFEIIQSTFEQVVNNFSVNPQLYKPTVRHPARDTIYEGIKHLDIDVFKKPEFRISMTYRVFRCAKVLLQHIFPAALLKSIDTKLRRFIQK